ncbi:MAG: hypothetical protein VKS61_09645 [Candidatus Sericytochromatia bacterium]|nr:hypothetical protein [Candidatus Sericytochromatia bacterium]
MSLTLRGMAESAWNVVKYVNPVTGPYFIAKALIESKQVRDTVKVAADTTARAAKSAKEAADVVLDYPIDEGAKKAYDATARTVDSGVRTVKQGAQKVYDETAEAVESGVKTVKDGYNRTIDALDDAQEDARREVADWIAPDAPPATAAPTPTRPAIALPKNPAETKSFQEKFNQWLATPDGQAARDAGIAPLKEDGQLGPLTRYALAIYNQQG